VNVKLGDVPVVVKAALQVVPPVTTAFIERESVSLHILMLSPKYAITEYVPDAA
jgi:hypothetical protein